SAEQWVWSCKFVGVEVRKRRNGGGEDRVRGQTKRVDRSCYRIRPAVGRSEPRQLDAARPHVSQVDQKAAEQFALDLPVVLQRVRRPQILVRQRVSQSAARRQQLLT